MTNTKKLIEVIQNNREEIIKLSKEIYRKTMDGSYFQGWKIGIIVDTNENIYDFYWSTGSSNTAIYEGRAIKVIDYTVDNEVEIYTSKEDLTEEEFENFTNWLLEEGYIEESEDAEDQLSYNRIKEFDRDIIDRIEEETIDFNVSEYYYETADEQIDQTLEHLELLLQNEEYEEAQ